MEPHHHPLQDQDREQRHHHPTTMKKIEKAIINKLKDIHAIKERLYTLRHDTTQPQEDTLRDVENLIHELKRLESGLLFLREEAWRNFEQSLDLPALGLAEGYLTRTIKGEPLGAGAASVVNHTQATAEGAGVRLDDSSELKMMRTRSTKTLEDKSPQEKWQAMFRMFQEWRRHTTLAEAQRLSEKDAAKALKREQVAKLRAAVYTLQQKKELTQSDQLLLQQLSQRLRMLHST